jgi:hypothetical protein
VDTVIGLIGFALFIPAIIGLAAAMTWVVVKLSPGTKNAKTDASG